MSATADRYDLHVHDHRTEALNSTPSRTMNLTNLPAELATRIASFVINRDIEVPGTWSQAIAGGVRHLEIVPTPNTTTDDEPGA